MQRIRRYSKSKTQCELFNGALGDQLSIDSAALQGFSTKEDIVWMAEVTDEANYVWSHKARIAIFLSAMRHFRKELTARGKTIEYHALEKSDEQTSFSSELEKAVKKHKPKKLIVVEPGEWRVKEALQQKADDLGLPLEMRPDEHFLCSLEEFDEYAEGKKSLRQENFYHEMRRKTGILMRDDQPEGDTWNYDKENRESFGREGPGEVPEPLSFRPDDITRQVIELVNDKFADHPGTLANFNWAVTSKDAQKALDDFIENRLPLFGPYEDALWTSQPFLYHSRLSSAFNLKLLDPRTAMEQADEALQAGKAPIRSVEGFVRQLLGWREYIRGVYWRFMPEYEHRNALEADMPLPPFYWTAETDMNCMRACLGQTLDLGYAHHIQRLMITGLFALLFGTDPHEVHRWYLAIYVDAVEWVEMPNVLGMSQFADGGLMATKPYAASGSYINRMSNYCKECRYKYREKTGDDACPFTTLYWDFLIRKEKILKQNARMNLQLRNIGRYGRKDRREIQKRADFLKESFT